MSKAKKAPALPAISERAFQAQVMQLLRAFGWSFYHTWLSARSAPGFPDLVCVKGRRLVFLELKAEKGRLTTSQELWLSLLQGAGQEAYVFRPSQWNEIVRVVQSPQ